MIGEEEEVEEEEFGVGDGEEDVRVGDGEEEVADDAAELEINGGGKFDAMFCFGRSGGGNGASGFNDLSEGCGRGGSGGGGGGRGYGRGIPNSK